MFSCQPPTNDDQHSNLVHDAYSRLSHAQLLLFLSVRGLSTEGSDHDLAGRLAQYDFQTFPFPNTVNKLQAPKLARNPRSEDGTTSRPRQQPSRAPDLPIELIALILDHAGDWELSKAVGLPTSLHRPLDWTRASPTDEAILSGYLPLIRAADPAANPPTKLGAILAVRFGYVHVLDHLLHTHRTMFLRVFREDLIPITASHRGRTSVLTWWLHQVHKSSLPPPQVPAIVESIDGACRTGARVSLDWWKDSGLHVEYTEASLENASAKNHVHILEWWKRSRLSLKIGRVMDAASSAGHVAVLEWWLHSQLEFKYDKQALHHASLHGKVDVLEWWFRSGLQLIFDQDALVLATRHNRPEVLEWWDRSGLPAPYRMCDIEEALEDAIGGGEAARLWWRKKGVDFNANDAEWMKMQTLN
ncbi:hypothetical protein BD410DRAFT_787889 [Rickenella mellea]|uniref:SAP domain-containing protein n=1 Tax=Rickenella mellea TaxID=50990 RepID=A0A4Y7Q6V8_9AGAM|nr:hypothetical protein BD410DRAFT_787889 [Rickenella mellea]